MFVYIIKLSAYIFFQLSQSLVRTSYLVFGVCVCNHENDRTQSEVENKVSSIARTF